MQMVQVYTKYSNIFKVLADPNRVKIIDILSCGEKCACDLLGEFKFSQPTLSHHMKILVGSGLVSCREDGLWRYYSLNENACNQAVGFLSNIMTEKKDCICHKKINNCK